MNSQIPLAVAVREFSRASIYVVDNSSSDNNHCVSDTMVQQTPIVMKIKMHYLFGKKQKVACGKKNVLVTTNYREITCGLCKRTAVHKATRNDTQSKV